VADSPAEPWAGAGFPAGYRIAGYRLTEQIGRGGMAIVYRAQDERLNREVALKVLAPSQAADGAFRQRFIQESHAAAAVDDPNIIPVFEAGEAAGVLFIAMRLVRGGDVRSLVRRDGRLPVQRAVRIMAAAASALDTAHAAGLVHRDIKPANMLLDVRPGRPDHVYVSDFGLSKSSLGSSGLTGSGQFLGTVDYAAPEQLSGKHVDGRADQYALGCTAYELLCGQPPYRRDQGLAVIYAHMTAPPPQPTRVRPDLPAVIKRKSGILSTILERKYGFDDFNDWFFAGGARTVGGGLWKWGDRTIIDGIMVNGTARLIGWFAGVARKLQTGYIYTYAFTMIFGVFALLSFFWLFLRKG